RPASAPPLRELATKSRLVQALAIGNPPVDRTGFRGLDRPARPALLVASIDDEAENPQHEVRRAHHQIDAVVISTRLPHGVVVLRTGGSDGFLSGRARTRAPRQRHRDGDGQEETEPGEQVFWVQVHYPYSSCAAARGIDGKASSRRLRQ